jgi:hypothetical protein
MVLNNHWMKKKLRDSLYYDEIHLLDFKGKDFLVFYPKKQIVRFHINWIGGKDESRYNYAAETFTNFLYLNPGRDPEIKYKALEEINRKCIHPFTDRELGELFEDCIALSQEPDFKELVLAQSCRKKNYRAYVLNPNLEDNLNSTRGAAMGAYKREKALVTLVNVIRNWNPRWGKMTNENLAVKSRFELSKVNHYSKRAREIASRAIKPEPRPIDPNLFYDLKGIGYSLEYILSTEHELIFPVPGRKGYTINQFGEVYNTKENLLKPQKTNKGEYIKVQTREGRKNIYIIDLIESVFGTDVKSSKVKKEIVPFNLFNSTNHLITDTKRIYYLELEQNNVVLNDYIQDKPYSITQKKNNESAAA